MLVLTLPYPPSVNSMWRTPRSGPLAGRTMLSQEGRDYRLAVEMTIAAARTKGMDIFFERQARLVVDIEAQMPDRRKRDLDNLPKAILDALTHAGVWSDDGQIDDLRIRRGDLHPGGRVILAIEELCVEPVQGELLGEVA